jgi:hypothetical protein
MIGVERVKNLKICFPAAADVGGDDGGIQDLLPRVQISIRAVGRSKRCWVIIDISPNRGSRSDLRSATINEQFNTRDKT